MSELRKEVPSGTQYDIEGTFGSKKTLLKTKAATFKNNYSRYSRTCDIQRGIKVYNAHAEGNVRGVGSYETDNGVSATKKRAAAFSQAKARQFTLWEKGKSLLNKSNFDMSM